MVKLWHESERVSGATRPPIRAITKPTFLALTEEERGRLLEDFIVVKDTGTPSEFFPSFV
jgi:hypothetical protein